MTYPEHLALAGDGSLWMTDEYYGITRLDPDGRVTHYLDDYTYDTAEDIVVGPDGAIWFAGGGTVGRIDQAGTVASWPVGGFHLARAITAANGALWFTNYSDSGQVERLSTDGAISAFSLSGPRASLDMSGIASGSDGALWFTQAGWGRDPGDGIGRLTSDGRYSSWRLPQRRANPTRIAAGPDGALWFTEQDAHAIGRITTAGAISEVPLRTGLSPYDITAGSDGALWFTADSCIGRITTSGQVSAWPVHTAGRLVGIVAAPDGSFWLADDLHSTVWHFTPPAGDVAPPVACHPPTITRQAGATRATLVYRRDYVFSHSDWFTDARVSIARGGKQLFSEVVPPNPQGDPSYAVYGDTSSFAVRDLDGDGAPEVMLELNWNGTHCCDWTRVYRYDRARHTYLPVNHFWGNDSASPTLKDLNGDGRPEFISQDDRFAYDFDGYAGSVRPIQIWSYDQGRFSDVTRRYAERIEQDAATIWRLYLKERGKPHNNVRGILPAWAADEYMLGRAHTIDRTLENIRQHGYLNCASADACFDSPHDPAAYIKALKALLRKTGYIPR